MTQVGTKWDLVAYEGALDLKMTREGLCDECRDPEGM